MKTLLQLFKPREVVEVDYFRPDVTETEIRNLPMLNYGPPYRVFYHLQIKRLRRLMRKA